MIFYTNNFTEYIIIAGYC